MKIHLAALYPPAPSPYGCVFPLAGLGKRSDGAGTKGFGTNLIKLFHFQGGGGGKGSGCQQANGKDGKTRRPTHTPCHQTFCAQSEGRVNKQDIL